VGGASAVQSVEVAPGDFRLLIGPPSGTPGPILFRDPTVNADWTNGAYAPYPAWDDKGVNLLCSTGQWAQVVHISAKSMPVGNRPTVWVLLNEIASSTDRPFVQLTLTDKSNDPSRTPASKSAYSDRYVTQQNGTNTMGDCVLTRFDYGTQNEPDELLDWAIYARLHDEREEQAATPK
jgi:hypothetical protein